MANERPGCLPLFVVLQVLGAGLFLLGGIALMAESDPRAGQIRHVHFKLAEEAYRNAEPLPLAGIAVLRNRDCLVYRSDGAVYHIFYDTFTRPEAEPYAGEPVDCAYCRQSLVTGVPAVMCPGCGLVFHHTEDGGCWLASDHCTNCGHSTALDQIPTWVPQGFEDSMQEVG